MNNTKVMKMCSERLTHEINALLKRQADAKKNYCTHCGGLGKIRFNVTGTPEIDFEKCFKCQGRGQLQQIKTSFDLLITEPWRIEFLNHTYEMKKVIAVLSDNSYIITTAENAAKKHWYIAYDVTVVKSEIAPNPEHKNKLPGVGSIIAGIGGFVYKISSITPTHICAKCGAKNSANRIEKKWYCVKDFNKLIVTKPIVKTGKIPERNDMCRCGSGIKYKYCCMDKDKHEPRHYFNSAYKNTKTA